MFGLTPLNRIIPIDSRSQLTDFHNIIDDFFNDNWSLMNSSSGKAFKLDLIEEDHQYIVEAELPGIGKDNISVDLTNNQLTISVKKETDSGDEQKRNYLHRERQSFNASRSIYLQGVQADGVTAKFTDGILTLAIPKKEDINKSTKIEIQ